MPNVPKTGLRAGDRAPSFTLTDQHGKEVELSHLLKTQNILLVFYPGDMTPGCTMQLCAMRDDAAKFQHKHIAVIGINHGDESSHRAFAKKYSLPFRLLVDTRKRVSERYGALRRIGPIRIIRRTVVGIAKDGTIVYLKHGMPKNAEILKAFH